MMIHHNYTQIISKARAEGLSQIDVNNNTGIARTPPPVEDRLTISAQALSLLKGEGNVVQEISPIYVRPQTAAQLLAENNNSQPSTQVTPSSVETSHVKSNSTHDSRFGEMMQAILDKRLGVDRKKLEELDALMEEIAKNEKLSPEQKAKAIAELEKMREEAIAESIEIKKTAKQTFTSNNKDS